MPSRAIARRFISGQLFHKIYSKSHVLFSSDFVITIEFLSTRYTDNKFYKKKVEGIKCVGRNTLCACTRKYRRIAFEKSNLFIDTFTETCYNVSHIVFYHISLLR